MRRRLLAAAAVLITVWLAFVGIVYRKMTAPPEEFAAFMAQLPLPAMMAFPFATLWTKARAGALEPGDAAPDFHLAAADGSAKVRLSDLRGRPVVLIFGSYT